MRTLKLILLVTALVLSVSACLSAGSKGEQFIGKWSNTGKGGNLILSVEKHGNSFLFSETIASNGKVSQISAARVEGDFLVVENSVFFSKMAYLKDEDSIIPLNTTEAMPAFRRVR